MVRGPFFKSSEVVDELRDFYEGYGLSELCRRSGRSDRRVKELMTGKTEKVGIDMADALLVAVGKPEVLSWLEPIMPVGPKPKPKRPEMTQEQKSEVARKGWRTRRKRYGRVGFKDPELNSKNRSESAKRRWARERGMGTEPRG